MMRSEITYRNHVIRALPRMQYGGWCPAATVWGPPEAGGLEAEILTVRNDSFERFDEALACALERGKRLVDDRLAHLL